MTQNRAQADKQRVDIWLWAARFFKTRSLASQAVDGGKIRLQGQRIKPAKAVQLGDELTIQIGAYEWVVTVRGLNPRRGPATVAHTMYEETSASQARRLAQVATRRIEVEPDAARRGRPSKRDRRVMGRLKGE